MPSLSWHSQEAHQKASLPPFLLWRLRPATRFLVRFVGLSSCRSLFPCETQKGAGRIAIRLDPAGLGLGRQRRQRRRRWTDRAWRWNGVEEKNEARCVGRRQQSPPTEQKTMSGRIFTHPRRLHGLQDAVSARGLRGTDEERRGSSSSRLPRPFRVREQTALRLQRDSRLPSTCP